MKTLPSYTFKILENARYPCLVTVILDGVEYSISIGSSQNQAKVDFVKATMDLLLPYAKYQIQINRKQGITETQVCSVFNGYKIFDQLIIKDPRRPGCCAKTTITMPYDM